MDKIFKYLPIVGLCVWTVIAVLLTGAMIMHMINKEFDQATLDGVILLMLGIGRK